MDTDKIERAEQEIDIFVERRIKENRTKRQDPVEDAWRESERREAERRAAESRLRWFRYHRDAAERHRAVLTSLIAEHEEAAAKFEAQMIEDGKRAS